MFHGDYINGSPSRAQELELVETAFWNIMLVETCILNLRYLWWQGKDHPGPLPVHKIVTSLLTADDYASVNFFDLKSQALVKIPSQGPSMFPCGIVEESSPWFSDFLLYQLQYFSVIRDSRRVFSTMLGARDLRIFISTQINFLFYGEGSFPRTLPKLDSSLAQWGRIFLQ